MTRLTWKKIRYRLEWLGLRMLAWIVSILPRRACVLLANLLGTLFYLVDRRGRAVAMENLELAFGDRFSVGERRRIARLSICNFARTSLDLFWSVRLNPENLSKYILCITAKDLDPPRAADVGVIYVCQHYGNWEWTSFLAGHEGVRAKVVAQEFHNPLLGPIFDAMRGLAGHAIIPRRGAMISVVKHLRRGGCIAMLTDLTLRPENASIVIDCFGMKTCVTATPAAFRMKFGCELVPVTGTPLADGRCRVELEKPLVLPSDANEQQIAQACWDVFVDRITDRPELWHWSYKLWRYRPIDATRPYPSYANVSKAFDRMLVRQQSISKEIP